MTSINEFDITKITPAQWTKLVAETAREKGNKHLYWNGKQLKYLNEIPSQTEYHLMSLAELWTLTNNIFTQNFEKGDYRSEARSLGKDLLRNLKLLILSEDDRISKISFGVFIPQKKELEGLKNEINQLDETLDLSSPEGSEAFIKAVKDNDVKAVERWVMFGADLNKPLKNGNTPLMHVVKTSGNPRMYELLLPDTDVFLDKSKPSAFQHLLGQILLYNSSSYKDVLAAFINKFQNTPENQKDNLCLEIRKALNRAFFYTIEPSSTTMDKFLLLIDALRPFGADINMPLPNGRTLLANYIQNGPNKLKAESLIKSGADVRLALKQIGFTKLMYAAWKGDLEAVKRILPKETKHFNLIANARDKLGLTALKWALRMSNQEIAKYLIEAGVNLDGAIDLAQGSTRELLIKAGAKNRYGETPLVRDILDGKNLDDFSIESLKPGYLNERDDKWETALHKAALCGTKYTKVAERLIKAGANINAINREGETPIMLAAKQKNYELVQLLIKMGANLNIKNKKGFRVLDIVWGQREIRDMLLDAGAKDQWGHNKLMNLRISGDKISEEENKLFDELIKKGFDLNAQDDKGETALSLAMWREDLPMVQKLLDAGANPKIGLLSYYGVLGYIMQKGPDASTIKMAETLIHKYGIKVETSTQLQYQVWKGDFEAVTKMLESPEIQINAQDVRGLTAVWYAAKQNNAKILKFLIEKGADVNLGNPLKFALVERFEEGVNLLLDAGANVNKGADGFSPLHWACGATQSAPLVEKLIKKGADVNETNSDGQTPLHSTLIINRNTKSIVDLLIKEKADVNKRNPNGETPLHIAIKYNDTESALALIPITRLNIQDNWGRTPLHIAILDSKKNRKAIEQILKENPDVNLMAEQATLAGTPLHYAISNGDFETASLLIPKTNLNLKNAQGQTALIHAINKQPKDFSLDPLIAHSDVNVKDNQGNSPLLWAASMGKVELMEKLIKAGADVDAENNAEESITTWLTNRIVKLENEIAARQPNPEQKKATITLYQNVLNRLLQQGARDHLGRTPLIRAVLNPSDKEADSEVKNWLLKQIDKINITDNFGMTAAMYAAKEGKVDLLKLLLDAGADLSIRDYDGNSILNYASESKGVLELLQAPMKELDRVPKDAGVEFPDSHFKSMVEPAAPRAPKNVKLDRFLSLFDRINTKNSQKPGYLNPARLKDDGTPKTLQQVRKSLELLIMRVKKKDETFQATPPQGPELIEYYTKLENALAVILEKISEPTFDPDMRTSVIFDLAIAGSHCGARYMTEIAAWYKFLTRGIEILTLPQEIEKILQNARIGVVEKMAKRAIFPDGRRINVGNRPHTYNQIVKTIGQEIGIPGVSETYDDRDFWIKSMTKEVLLKRFFRDYSVSAAIDRIDAAINGEIGKDGKRVPASREMQPAEVDLWFKGRMDPNWKMKEPLSFTTIDLAGEPKTWDYQTFIETVHKEFEAEKKRLAALPEDEITKDSKARVQEYLSGLYGLKLDDDVDFQHWEQVEKAIKGQLENLLPKYRTLLEDLEKNKLGEIKAYIESLKGRQNYANYMLGVFLNKFGIMPPSNRQDWEAVKQVIENMRRQEYVDTEIRKEGMIPRETIKKMLLDMGVLKIK